tara:strand:+ start:3448 stop:3678 length:231 start_codon:yes stop_codon:yes gene_type:complete
MAKKKVKKSAARIAAKISDEQKRLLLSLINHSSNVVRSTLEVGSAMANDCVETQYAVWHLAREFGLKQDNYWEDYK